MARTQVLKEIRRRMHLLCTSITPHVVAGPQRRRSQLGSKSPAGTQLYAPGADFGAECFRLGFEHRNRLRTGQRRELHRRAEAGAGEGGHLVESVGTARDR